MSYYKVNEAQIPSEYGSYRRKQFFNALNDGPLISGNVEEFAWNYCWGLIQ